MKFENLWATTIFQDSLELHEKANIDLSKIILEKNKVTKNMTEEYKSENFLKNNHDSVTWLKNNLVIAINKYIYEANIKYNFDYSIFAWANVNMRGDYHVPHNHPHSWLSGVYYVSVPIQQDTTHRKDLAPANISFFDPRAHVNMLSIEGDKQNRDEYRVLPQAGDLLLFPSFLQHMAHPNMSDEPRVSISFNVSVTLHKPS